jgi:hypothetical protein
LLLLENCDFWYLWSVGVVHRLLLIAIWWHVYSIQWRFSCAKLATCLLFRQIVCVSLCMYQNTYMYELTNLATSSDSYRYLRSKQLFCVELYAERLSVMYVDITWAMYASIPR